MAEPMGSGCVIYTCGHSDRPAEAFLSLLRDAGIRAVADVRIRPASRRHPQFSREAFSAALQSAGISYVWLGRELGGHRRARAGSPHLALPPEGFRGYADHTQSALFRAGLERLVELAGAATLAVMCAERLPEHCHRSFIADRLLVQGHAVVHLLAPGESAPHVLSPLARRVDEGLVYDRHTTAALDLE